jgi:hypothetical protein
VTEVNFVAGKGWLGVSQGEKVFGGVVGGHCVEQGAADQARHQIHGERGALGWSGRGDSCLTSRVRSAAPSRSEGKSPTTAHFKTHPYYYNAHCHCTVLICRCMALFKKVANKTAHKCRNFCLLKVWAQISQVCTRKCSYITQWRTIFCKRCNNSYT